MNQAADGPRAVRVISAYEAAFPDPWFMRTGQRLAVSDKKTDWDGWLWCTAQDGQSRWVPDIYVRRQGDTCLALCDYEATELTVHAGEELMAYQGAAEWVWCTNQRGQSGWVPAANLTPSDAARKAAED